MNKKTYTTPALWVTTLSQQHQLLAGSTTSTGPAADFMQDPSISGSRTGSSSHASRPFDDDEDDNE